MTNTHYSNSNQYSAEMYTDMQQSKRLSVTARKFDVKKKLFLDHPDFTKPQPANLIHFQKQVSFYPYKMQKTLKSEDGHFLCLPDFLLNDNLKDIPSAK